MIDERIKSYLKDRLKRLEDIKNKREWTTAELGDATCCKQTLTFINSLQDEPVSEKLEKAAVEWFNSVKYKSDLSGTPINAFKAGAQWQKEKDQKK